MSVLLKRGYEIYISKAPNATADATNTVKLLVEDFSWNLPTSSIKVGRETLDSTQNRGYIAYLSTISPVNFSLTTYILPLVDTNVTSPEEYLWTSLMGNDSIAGSPNSTPTSSTIDFSEGNVGTLQELTLWFDYAGAIPLKTGTSYRLNNAVIDSVTINFDINGIAKAEWTGRALSMNTDTTPPAATDRTNIASTNYIKNRLSTCSLVSAFTYDSIILTGGSITINNNNTFYSRTELGVTTEPAGHYTGNRDIEVTISAYMKGESGENMKQFYSDLTVEIGGTNYDNTWDSDITINLGGTTPPYIQINVPSCLPDFPQLQFDETITADVKFLANEGAGTYCSIIYFA